MRLAAWSADIIPEAHQTRDTTLSNLIFIASFAGFALFLSYFGEG
jgi:hypothetical protein